MTVTTIKWRPGDKLFIQLSKQIGSHELFRITKTMNTFLRTEGQDAMVFPYGVVEQIVVLQNQYITTEAKLEVEVRTERLLRFEEGEEGGEG